MTQWQLTLVRLTVASLVTIAPASAAAHPVGSVRPDNLWSTWTFEVWMLLVIVVPALVYVRGTARVWRAAGVGRGIRPRNVASFAAGVSLLALALVSPLDALGR